MDLEHVIAAIESPTKESLEALLADDATVFWVDWRQEDETIADSCERVLRTGQLSGELVEIDSEDGYEVYVQFRDRRVKVPLTNSADDRHLTLCALNQILAPEFEVRFCIHSNGADTLAFLPLRCDQWAALESQFGDAVGRQFYKLAERPNVFTDPLPF